MDKKHRLRDLPPEDRPRERLREVGVDNLSLQELLALIIEKGGRSQNVLQVSQNLLSHFGNLKKIKEASVEELRQVKGIGLATRRKSSRRSQAIRRKNRNPGGCLQFTQR